jgi:hypothetical protein
MFAMTLVGSQKDHTSILSRTEAANPMHWHWDYIPSLQIDNQGMDVPYSEFVLIAMLAASIAGLYEVRKLEKKYHTA